MRPILRLAVLLAWATVACAGSVGSTAAQSEPVIDPEDEGLYRPVIDPADFRDTIDNPYLPLIAGSRWVYEGTADGELERVEVVVTGERREVMGVMTTVVRDTVEVGGELVEDTFDWYAQDRAGNVWYFGEAVADYENGVMVSSAGSWEAGVDGALPGIVMPAEPVVGLVYRQEYWVGQAEDLGEVIAVDRALSVAAGSYQHVITTRDWTSLEPEVVEEKDYAPGVGLVRETKVAGGDGQIELIEHAPGP